MKENAPKKEQAWLLYKQGKSHEEIAKLVGVSKGSVRQWSYLGKWKQRLKDETKEVEAAVQEKKKTRAEKRQEVIESLKDANVACVAKSVNAIIQMKGILSSLYTRTLDEITALITKEGRNKLTLEEKDRLKWIKQMYRDLIYIKPNLDIQKIIDAIERRDIEKEAIGIPQEALHGEIARIISEGEDL